MSARCIPARDICKRKGDNLRPVERDNPTNRTDKAEVQIAPTHTVREGDRTNQLRQEFREELRCLRPLLMHRSIDIAVPLNECRGLNPLPARKARARLRWISLRIKGNSDRGTARLRADILLPFGKPRHEKCRTARCADRTQVLVGEATLREQIPRETIQISEEVRHNVRRYFLRPDLKQQILTHAFPSFFNIG